MELNLAEQVLLLGLREDKGDTGMRDLSAGLAGALLVDLGEVGALRLDGKVLHAEPPQPEHPVLARAHALIAAARPRTAKAWVTRLPKEFKQIVNTVADPMVGGGLLRREESKVLGLINRTRHFPVEPGPRDALLDRLEDILVEYEEPTHREALLIGLMVPMDLVKEAVTRERKGADKRAREIAEEGVAGTAVRDVVREVQAAVLTAVVVGAAVAGSDA